MGNTASVQIQLIGIHLTTNSHQKVRTRKIPLWGMHSDRVTFAANLFGLGIFDDINSLITQVFKNNRSHFGVIFTKRFRPFNDSYAAAKAAMGLRHFHADGTAANNNQMFRLFTQVKDIFVGIVLHLIQPRDRWDKRAGSGGHNKPAGLDDIITSLHFGF